MSIDSNAIETFLLYNIILICMPIRGPRGIICGVENGIEYQLNGQHCHHEYEEDKYVPFHHMEFGLLSDQLHKEDKKNHISKYYR